MSRQDCHVDPPPDFTGTFEGLGKGVVTSPRFGLKPRLCHFHVLNCAVGTGKLVEVKAQVGFPKRRSPCQARDIAHCQVVTGNSEVVEFLPKLSADHATQGQLQDTCRGKLIRNVCFCFHFLSQKSATERMNHVRVFRFESLNVCLIGFRITKNTTFAA